MTREEKFQHLVAIKGGAGVLANNMLDRDERIAELEAALAYLVSDVEALHEVFVPTIAGGGGSITDKERANLARAKALVPNYSFD